jgi:hypothetical protein
MERGGGLLTISTAHVRSTQSGQPKCFDKPVSDGNRTPSACDQPECAGKPSVYVCDQPRVAVIHSCGALEAFVCWTPGESLGESPPR